MLIDCDTCTVRGQGCDDCVVTVLLGAPPGWRGSEPTVVPLTRRRPTTAGAGDDGVTPAAAAAGPAGGPRSADPAAEDLRPVVELDEVEHRAVRALAEFGLVPPLRHQVAPPPHEPERQRRDRHVS